MLYHNLTLKYFLHASHGSYTHPCLQSSSSVFEQAGTMQRWIIELLATGSSQSFTLFLKLRMFLIRPASLPLFATRLRRPIPAGRDAFSNANLRMSFLFRQSARQATRPPAHTLRLPARPQWRAARGLSADLAKPPVWKHVVVRFFFASPDLHVEICLLVLFRCIRWCDAIWRVQDGRRDAALPRQTRPNRSHIPSARPPKRTQS